MHNLNVVPAHRGDPYAVASRFLARWLTPSAPADSGGYGSPACAGTTHSMARSYSTNCHRSNFQTVKTISNAHSHSRGARRPSRAGIVRPTEGVGNAGCPLHPQPRAQSVVTHTSVVTTGPPEHPAFPHAMGLTAYLVLSPATNSSCHRPSPI